MKNSIVEDTPPAQARSFHRSVRSMVGGSLAAQSSELTCQKMQTSGVKHCWYDAVDEVSSNLTSSYVVTVFWPINNTEEYPSR